jgi:hypothetical protein
MAIAEVLDMRWQGVRIAQGDFSACPMVRFHDALRCCLTGPSPMAAGEAA